MMKSVTTIDDYIALYPKTVQIILHKLRQEIKKVAPSATETISYGIPTFKLNGNLVHFGAYAQHIGFYPGPEAINAFTKELSSYECSKGTVKFPLDSRIPYTVIKDIVKFRVKKNTTKKKA